MKYPYLKIVHEEIADGGWAMAITDMVYFAVKVFIFISVGYFAVYMFAQTWAAIMAKNLSPACIQEIANVK